MGLTTIKGQILLLAKPVVVLPSISARPRFGVYVANWQVQPDGWCPPRTITGIFPWAQIAPPDPVRVGNMEGAVRQPCR